MTSKKTLAYLGPEGTFSHEAAAIYTKGRCYELRGCLSIKDALNSVGSGECGEAIVPIENSLEGAVNVTLDVLAEEEGLFISGELIIPINLNLVGRPGTELGDIKTILSHPQPLGQSRNYLNAAFPEAIQLEESSTSRAAQMADEGDGSLAAIASRTAAELYGLEVLAPNIQDVKNNYTRFVVVSSNRSGKTGNDKTSIVFSTENKPGSLYRILDIFSLWDINMTRIESRPAKNALGQYIFFIDIDGHTDDQDVGDALTMVRRKTSFFRVIGSYPRYVF